MTITEAVLSVISVAGTAGTFYYGIKSFRLAQDKLRFSWDDISVACRQLRHRAISRFKPQVFVCFSGPSSIVASILMQLSACSVPMFVVFIEKRLGAQSDVEEMPEHRRVETTKWIFYIPEVVFSFADKRALLVDDCVISGESLLLLKQLLIENDFKVIKTCSMVCTYAAKQSNKQPDFYHYLVDNGHFFMPWGEVY